MAARPDSYEGYHNYLLKVVDISDPEQLTEVGQWEAPGQHPDEEPPSEWSFVSTPGPLEESYFHGPAYRDGDRAYLSYGRLGLVVLKVANPESPEFLGRLDFGGLGSCLGTHSAVPIPDSDHVVVNSEAILEHDRDSLNYVFLVDVSDPERPRVVSSLPQPTPADSLPYRNYYEKGGRFGPHNQHHYQGQTCLWKPSSLVFVAYFNAGLRVFDISDPLSPREVGSFVPENPSRRAGTLPDTLVTQFEDVLVDARGYIYCSTKNQGLFVLEHDRSFDGYA